jgi:hypothetical protein
MLIATNQRLLLVDRKPMFLTIEAIWYDKIVQFDFNHRLMNSTVRIFTPNKQLSFTSVNQGRMHSILVYSQEMMIVAKQEHRHELDSTPQTYQVPQPIAELQNSATPVLTAPQLSEQQTPITSLTAVNPARSSSVRLPFSRRRYFAPTTRPA